MGGCAGRTGDDNYNREVCVRVGGHCYFLSVCMSIMCVCVCRVLQACFNSRRKEAVSEWRPGPP